mmetsp:Transcript_31434/g.40434  ORF Transcript_31434/g.40434 Transcript_31434/m.40434 type:complete len:131 (-) Transcript_31434:12-404(-)
MAVYVWGSNKFGQLGCSSDLSTVKGCEWVPKLMENIEGTRIQSIAAGEGHTMIVTEFGDVMTVGRGREGQLGVGNLPQQKNGCRLDQGSLQHVAALKDEEVIGAVCGAHSSMCVTASGRLVVFGEPSAEG